MGGARILLILSISFSLLESCTPWGWFSSANSNGKEEPSKSARISHAVVAEFSMDALTDEKGIQRIDNARQKLAGSKSCWQDAYEGLFAKCEEIADDESEKKKRFAWELSNCFEKSSGRPPFPSCPVGSLMKECLKKLDDNAIHTYRDFLIETNSICHQLQSYAFRRETEQLVNDLKSSAGYAEAKLESIEKKSTTLLSGFKDFDESLNSVHQLALDIGRTAMNVSQQIDDVQKTVFEQANKIAASQTELQGTQENMKQNLEEGMLTLYESSNNLGKEIFGLRNNTLDIGRKVSKVGMLISKKMKILQSKADDISNVAGITLDKQKELLQWQYEAADAIKLLAKSIEEGRGVLQQLSELGREQRDELLRKHEQLKKANNFLVENAKAILSAQEAFEQKQAYTFLALEKLSALLNAALLESRVIKTFFIYTLFIFIIYMFTCLRQTYKARPMLYIGLCATFVIEVLLLRCASIAIEQQTWIINSIRLIFVSLALLHILYSIYTFRDYEKLNYMMLESLYRKVNNIEKRAELTWESESDDDLTTWVDSDVSDGLDNINDGEEVASCIRECSKGTSTSTRRYNLRSRGHSTWNCLRK